MQDEKILKGEKKSESPFSDWYQIITSLNNFLPQFPRSNANDL